jgi:hypothetical protein
MRNLAPNTYADLKTGRRLVVAIPRCKACAPKGFHDSEHTKRHNERCANYGERAYPVERYRRVA